MRKALAVVLTVTFVLFGTAMISQAADTATQAVNFEVKAIDMIDVTPASVSLVIEDDTLTDTDNSSIYTITTNGTGKKVTAALDADMPTGLTLKVQFSYLDGTPATEQTLSVSPQDVLTGISQATGSSTITYTLVAEPTVAPTTGSNTVTFTLTDGA
ncbi:MAG TPA: hypothetical protein PK188_05930 [Thermosynergistes sp.]|nr:hypothetical protein [Thermosynergistes sp.]